MSTEVTTICWLSLLPLNVPFKPLDGSMKRSVGFPSALGGCVGMHDGRVVAAEVFGDLWVGRPRQPPAEVHSELTRDGNPACTAARA